jgi:hypothetical protein
MRLALACSLAVLTGSALLPGCRTILGIEPREEFEETQEVFGRCGGFGYLSSTCQRCMDDNCCLELEACHASPTCDARLVCTLTCAPQDAECRSRCATNSLARYGSGQLDGIYSCRAANCAGPCSITCGGLDVVNSVGAACQDCVSSRCCSQAAECGANKDCLRLQQCPCIFGDIACLEACRERHASGLGVLEEYDACHGASCAKACATGKNWSCLGSPITFPMPRTSGTAHLETGFIASYAEAHAGITVKVCHGIDTECEAPTSVSTTDLQGRVALNLPLGKNGFDGYLDLSGGMVTPTLFFFNAPPIVESVTTASLLIPKLGPDGTPTLVDDVPLLPGRGAAALLVNDCGGKFAGGVVLEASTADSETTPFYYFGVLPSTTVNQTQLPVAIGGFLNLPAQYTVVTASLAADGRRIGAVGFLVRDGSLTISDIAPTP